MKNDEFLAKQKIALLEEKKRLETEIKKLSIRPDYGESEDDNAQEASDSENNLSIERELAVTLSKVEKALKAIENGSYGQCHKCKAMIEDGRLEIMPYADLCVTCQSKK